MRHNTSLFAALSVFASSFLLVSPVSRAPNQSIEAQKLLLEIVLHGRTDASDFGDILGSYGSCSEACSFLRAMAAE